MSKTKTANKPPSTDGRMSSIKNTENAKPAEDASAPGMLIDTATPTATITVPMSPTTCGYKPRRCDVGSLSGVQSTYLRRITNGLLAEDAKLADGRRVINPQDAIKWMLEQVGE